MNVNKNGKIIRSGIPTVKVLTGSPYTTIANTGYNVLLVDCTSGVITVNLATAINNSDCYVIKKTDSTTNSIDIHPNGTETIDGSATTIKIKIQYISLTLVSDGTNWFII
jgi:hypothetical protein